MSPSIPWCQKYRPSSFAEVIGQSTTITTLENALASGKVAPAYIFSGAKGSGKTSTARLFARALNCSRMVPCSASLEIGYCDNCRSILNGSALDVLEIDAASNRGIDDAKKIRSLCQFVSFSMPYKVFIIDEAHQVTKDAWNALLKTLEEPPPNTVFLLCTTSPESFPDTIHSRCQHLYFGRVPSEKIDQALNLIAVAENLVAGESALQAIASRANGSMRDAITTLEQIATHSGGTITVESAQAAFGGGALNYPHKILAAIIKNDPAEAIGLIAQATKGGVDLSRVLDAIVQQCRHALLASLDEALLDDEVEQADKAFALRHAKKCSELEVARVLRIFVQALVLAKSTGLPRFALETAIVNSTIEAGEADKFSSRLDLIERSLKIGAV
jgi:DNA polymerase-3 subunit gamma/tau